MNDEGYSLGFGYELAPKSPIAVPKMNSKASYGTKKPFVKAHGGDQYGVTMHKSDPAISFPTSPAGFAAGSVVKRGY